MIYVSTKAYKYQKVHLMIWIFNKKNYICIKDEKNILIHSKLGKYG